MIDLYPYLHKARDLEMYSRATAHLTLADEIFDQLNCPKCSSQEFEKIGLEDLSTYLDDIYHRFWITCPCGHRYSIDKDYVSPAGFLEKTMILTGLFGLTLCSLIVLPPVLLWWKIQEAVVHKRQINQEK